MGSRVVKKKSILASAAVGSGKLKKADKKRKRSAENQPTNEASDLPVKREKKPKTGKQKTAENGVRGNVQHNVQGKEKKLKMDPTKEERVANDHSVVKKEKRQRKEGREKKSKAVPPPANRNDKNLGSNWQALKQQLEEEKKSKPPTKHRAKRKAHSSRHKLGNDRANDEFADPSGILSCKDSVVAIDCEMVDVDTPDICKSVAAHIALVDGTGDVLLDTYARPAARITDFKTKFSGIRPYNLKTAPPLSEIKKKVSDLLEGKVVVGHALYNDFRALSMEHPKELVRDTARYPPLMRGYGVSKILEPNSLRNLAQHELGMKIQTGTHSPVEDARTALYIYHKHRQDWEEVLARGKFDNAKEEERPSGNVLRLK